MNDRFGDVPEPTDNLIRISKLRNTALALGFTSIEQKERIISFYNPNIDIEKCAVIASEDPFKGAVMISLGGKPHISYKLRTGDSILDASEKIIERYSQIIN